MKVLNTLLQLKKKNIFYKNIFYKNITINYQKLDSQKDKFIFIGISFEILQCNYHHKDQKKYLANLNTNNYKNKLYYIVDSVKLDTNKILSDYFYININNTQTYLILKLISVITNYKNNAVFSQDIKLLILTYINKNNSFL